MAKRFRGRLVCFLFLFTVFARAEIVEKPTMREALSTVDADTLVVFDLDNTLIEPVQFVGSDEWFDERVKYHASKVEEKAKATDLAIVDWVRVMKVTQVKAVEADTPVLIRALQEKKIKIMGLTARPISLSSTTHNQLDSVGIDLSKTPPAKTHEEILSKHRAELIDGIVFIGPHLEKGAVLRAFLRHENLRPKRLVFVDDRVQHVNTVHAAAEALKLPHLCVRYGAADNTVKKFHEYGYKLADLQWRILNSILGNDEAETLLKAGSN